MKKAVPDELRPEFRRGDLGSYAFSVCKHLLRWRGLFDSPVVRPPYENVPTWL